MGNFEKLVVLTVLFLSAIVLAISLSSDGEVEGGMTPFADAALQARGETGPPDVTGETATGAPRGAGNDRLTMSAEGERKAAPRAGSERAPAAGGNDAPADPEEQAASLPARAVNAEGQPRVLRTRLGLTPSPLEDYMVYTAAENDTWSLLAERFYRSATYVPLLRAANEDLERPRANEAILVPVYDFRAAPADHEPRRAAPARSPAQEPAPAGTTYEVVDGDNLWKIASKVYGSGVRWMDLYEANKDVMSDPDALTIGMNLRIPR